MSSIAERLRALKKANYKETEPLSFPDGTRIILSTMTSKEDRTLSDYLLQHVDKATGHYAKLETLCHTIKWIQRPGEEEIDLRDVEYIDTGSTLENGTPVKQPKHVFLRSVVETWNDVLVDTLFMRYARLVDEMEEEVTKNIKIEMADDVLLSRIESKSEELQALIEKAASQGLKSKTVFDFTPKPMGEEGADKLMKAFQAKGVTAPTPAPAPPPAKPPRQPNRYDPPQTDPEESETPSRVRS